MRGGFRHLLRRFCLEGTILGLKYFYLYPSKISRCYWLICTAGCLYLGCLLSVLLYYRFEAMPTRISIENQFEFVPELPFPSVTICSPNQVTASAVRHFDKTFVDGNRSIDLTSALAQLIGFYQPGPFSVEDLETLQMLIDTNRYTIPEVMMALPQRCDRFLKLCYFHQVRYPRCQGLFKPILTHHGLCCTFNNVYHYRRQGSFVRNMKDDEFEPHRVSIWGLSHGLTVVADFEPQDAVDGSVTFAGASQVMITDWSEFPVDDEAVLVPPHVESFNIIRATYTYCSPDVKDLPVSSRKCYFEDENPLPFFRKYHNSDCDTMCLAHAVELKCHCLLFYLPQVYLIRACNVTMLPCVMDVMVKIKDLQLNDECHCPRDCESRRYRVDVSQGNLDGMKHMIRNSYAEVNFTETTTLMHFFFPNSVYVKQKQETVMSITTLASNLGGVFGLCVGCSVISLYEIAFYLRKWVRNAIVERYHRTWHRKVGFHH